MNVIEAIRTRKSVRQFRNQIVEEEKLVAVLDAGRLAPSASNRQEWRFLIVREAQTLQQLVEIAGGQAFVGQAPVVIVACAETDEYRMTCGQLCYPIDVAIALDHITLAAVEQGLGTCWIGKFDEQKVKQLLGIPKGVRVVELMPLGYPVDPSPVQKPRFPLEKVVKYERW